MKGTSYLAMAALAAGIATSLPAAEAAQAKADGDGMIWGFMIQLGHNMWRESPLFGDPEPEKIAVSHRNFSIHPPPLNPSISRENQIMHDKLKFETPNSIRHCRAWS